MAEGRQHARLDGGLDDHDFGARPEAADEAERLALGAGEARGRDVRRLHRGGRIEDDDDALGAVTHHGDGGAREGEGEGNQHEQLQDEQRIALETLEEGRGLTIAQRRVPEEETRHGRLASPHLEEVQQQQGEGEHPHEQSER